MLGRRNPQRSFFDAQSLPHRVAEDSFYGRMGAVSEVLFCDDDLAEMYCSDNGRPSLPPSLMSGVILLQFYDDVSDGEAVARTMYDLRWKVALNLPLDFAGFDPSSLSVFRTRLVEHGEERYAFNRFIEVGRAAGFIPDQVTLLVDTTPAKGAGAVQDTYTLLRKGVRRLLKAMGFHLPGQRQGMAAPTRALVATYLDQDGKADIDWADPQQRAAELKVLVHAVESTLELASEHLDDPEVCTLGWVLTKILGDDLVNDERGNPQIAQGTAPDRIISMTELDMRHGRKSAARRFDGFKVSAAMEPESELLLDVADIPAPGSDGKHLMPTIQRVEAQSGLEVARAIGDGAYNSGDNLVACANYPPHPVDLVVPFKRPADPEVDKSAFAIDLAGQSITCPQGHSVTGQPARDGQGRDILKFTFPRCVCATCPLFEACVRSQSTGRSITTHAYEAELQKARARQESEEFKILYPTRSKVERKMAELAYHGIRNTRYRGERKRQLQRVWTGAAVNLKRLFRLAQDRGVDLAAILAVLNQPQEALMGI